MVEQNYFLLPQDRLPKAWYNIVADLPFEVPPLLHPVTREPTRLPPPLFCDALIEQEETRERYVEIPEPVREVYRLWRPTPLVRARRLEQALDTPAHIYYKYEGASPPGSHKPNTAVAQAFYSKEAGVKRLVTETGAGQWGSALAFACNLFGMECGVYMVKVSYYQKPYRRVLMEAWGARVVPSPSPETRAGQSILERDPDSPGSLGIAISEAVEVAATHDDTKYSLGSVLNHVLLHQTIIGEEARLQMEMAGEAPDVVIGCVGGGSNFAGLAFPFLRDRLQNGVSTRFVAVEPTACPSMTKGIYAYDYGDTAHLAPLAKMDTLGHTFIPASIHAGGLRYHGMAPLVSALHRHGYIEPVAYPQLAVFEAAVLFARTEGFIPAPETAHAIRAAIDEALAAREAGEKRVILFNFSGHGHFDMGAYEQYFAGKLENYEYPAERVLEALKDLPKVEEQ
ncbi:MAG: TrpB-like pyridoxal phosphate-dependent enzyme [Anaerolineae bacterium]|nr:TrpB-like pyridoxal phosphate-dependent enzyme [Anaerolineae bacterium]MDW8067633.1 TrpB-like pyridoxal phosphate-dependent enzyme [Anaerolineae bacterium]